MGSRKVESAGAAFRLGAANWVTRYIEKGPTTYTAAASLAEVITARDTGGIETVVAYEEKYGVLPEAPVPTDVEPALIVVGAYEFVERWIAARRHLVADRP